MDDRIILPARDSPFVADPEITDSVELIGAGADRTVLLGIQRSGPNRPSL